MKAGVRRAVVVGSCASAFAAAAIGCGALFDLSALGPGEPDGAGGADALAADVITSDAGADGPAVDEDSSAPCTPDGGAASGPMKRIGSFCIDVGEVTGADYDQFLARADAGLVPAPRAACAGATDHVPSERYFPELPVSGVSFCDADAYCRSVGKRLCGGRAGASLTPTSTSTALANATTNEWYRACSKAGEKRLPYGNESVSGECATTGQLRMRGGRCEGGYGGIFDLVGNVEEWIDACASDDPGAPCFAAGGSGLDSLADCTTFHAYARGAKRPLAGFRCCAD